MPLIRISNLRFGFTAGKTLFDGLSVELDSGQALLLKGPNGAGKSTLLNLIAGVLKPASGRISLAGAPAYSSSGRRARWHMTAHPALYRLLTVREQLEFYAAAHGRDAQAALKLVSELIAEDVSDQLCAQLSTGQAQKVWFAASLAAHQAPIILLDEPFSAGDSASIPYMIDLLEEERKAGRALLLVTHTYQDLLPQSWVHQDLGAPGAPAALAEAPA